MDMLVEKLKGCSVLKGLGMKQGTGEGRDSLKLSLIVGSHKMVGDAGRASGAARRAAPESSSFSQPVSASRWSSVRQRILEAVRGSSNSNGNDNSNSSNNLGNRSRSSDTQGDDLQPRSNRGSNARDESTPQQSSAIVGAVDAASSSMSWGTRGTMVSALLALVELKKAHWTKGIYAIYDVREDPKHPNSLGRDFILACNLSRMIPFTPETSSIPAVVLSSFRDLNLEGNAETGSWDSASGLVSCFLHNGGPVNWSRAHQALVLINGAKPEVIESAITEALKGRIDDNGDESNRQETWAQVLPLVKEELAEEKEAEEGAEGGQQQAASSLQVIFGDFKTVFFATSLLREAGVIEMHEKITIRSFAGYAKWTRSQLLKEFLKNSWGGVFQGGVRAVKKGVLKPEEAEDLWEKLVDDSAQYVPSPASIY